jgi:hypothetical protein
MSEVPLGFTGSVAQSVSWDAVGQNWYVCQRNVTESDQDRLLVSRLDADGAVLDTMLILRAGHGANIGVERTDGDVFLWTDAMPVGGWASAIARVRYVAGGAADASDPVRTEIHMPRTGVHRVSATVDPTSRHLIYRAQVNNVSSPTATGFIDRYDLDAAAGGTFTRLGSMPFGASNQTLQGFTSLGDHVYTLYGSVATDNMTVTCAEWSTGNIVQSRRIGTFGSFHHREPEGICVYEAGPGDPAPTLAFGVADGTSGARNFSVARFPHPGTNPWVEVPYDSALYAANSAHYVPQFRLSGDEVHLHFSMSKVSGEPWSSGEVLFRLPERARPGRTQRLVGVVTGAAVSNDTLTVRFEVTTDGRVTVFDERSLVGWIGADQSFWRC